jgi:hypothetical protein
MTVIDRMHSLTADGARLKTDLAERDTIIAGFDASKEERVMVEQSLRSEIERLGSLHRALSEKYSRLDAQQCVRTEEALGMEVTSRLHFMSAQETIL